MIKVVKISLPGAWASILTSSVLMCARSLGQVEGLGSTSSVGASHYIPQHPTIVTHLMWDILQMDFDMMASLIALIMVFTPGIMIQMCQQQLKVLNWRI